MIYFTVQIDYQFYATQELYPIYILFIIMTNKILQIVNKPGFLEISDGKVLIPITRNILIKLFPASPVLPKILTIEHLPSNEKTHIEHEIDLLRQGTGKEHYCK